MNKTTKYFIASFTGMVVIFFSGAYVVSNFEGVSVASVLAVVCLVIATMFGWSGLMAKVILKK